MEGLEGLTLISRLARPVLTSGSAKDWDAQDIHSQFTFYDLFDQRYYTY